MKKIFTFGTLLLGCCLAVVAQVKQFDTDHDGTLTNAELNTPAGRRLLALIK